MKDKYDQMYEAYYETEKVINDKVCKIERNLHMKEEEVVRLKQILNNKEDIIRKVSIAYEQSKNSLEEYQDQIEYYKHQIEEYEKLDQNNLLVENQNLKMLLMAQKSME